MELMQTSFAQLSKDDIYADYTTYNKRKKFDIYLRDTAIAEAFKMPLDSDGEYGYDAACSAASQFMITGKDVEAGLRAMIKQYDSLQNSTKQSFFEAVFGLYPYGYTTDIKKLFDKEMQPKFFAIEAAYLLANDSSVNNRAYLLALLDERFPNIDSNQLLLQLRDYLSNHDKYIHQSIPDITALFANQKVLQQKVIYSFQRWNRDYPGLAILQNTDGTFAKDSTGKLLVFRQLARSTSNLPYFITDGNTPQGIYSITGVQVSRNHLLGPTPNIQMVMPFEDDQAYWGDTYDNSKDALTNYLNLLPTAWQHYKPITEAFYAGKIGRSAIICHGTTLNPAYFSGKSYYPISPTLGCLCAKEIWDAQTGKLQESEQLRLINAFKATPNDIGYVMVINLDDKQLPVSREEVEELVRRLGK